MTAYVYAQPLHFEFESLLYGTFIDFFFKIGIDIERHQYMVWGVILYLVAFPFPVT